MRSNPYVSIWTSRSEFLRRLVLFLEPEFSISSQGTIIHGFTVIFHDHLLQCPCDLSPSWSLGPIPLILGSKFLSIGCSERRLIGHSFYRWNFLRKSCATYREKCRRTAPRTEKSDKPAHWTSCIMTLSEERKHLDGWDLTGCPYTAVGRHMAA
jgi:hypothetical protein